jgi:hypothetical protein
MKRSIKVLLATIIFFGFFYNLSIGINIERTKTVNLFGISLDIADDTEQICDVTQGAFCKNDPPRNTGYCQSSGELNGVCCIFSQAANKDCFDVGH